MKTRVLRFLAVLALGALACGKKIETPPANYTVTIPGSNIQIEMVYVPGGEFEMGSPDTDPVRDPDEGPVRKVKVKPYWIGKTEVTWNQYELYAFVKDSTTLDAVTLASTKLQLSWFRNFGKWVRQQWVLMRNDSLDAVTRPSPYYGAYDFGMGRGNKPAIGISYIGATYFCDWLSKKTGQEFRLPTEAEWEFACRAGGQPMTGNLDENAWYQDNSDFESKNVGAKKPNAFGIYDMLGNAWELCQGKYDPELYKKLKADGVNVDPRAPKWKIGTKAVLRGGSWDSPASELRPANRLEQLDWWTERDPQRPRGIWWLIDGNVVGFRIVRSAE
jgi:formylglycine-generating enzyme required for sulfatase activity